MSGPLRNVISIVLFVVAMVAIVLELRYTHMGFPGPHRLALAAYIIVAVYALASLIARTASRPRR